MKYRIFYFWDAQNPETNEIVLRQARKSARAKQLHGCVWALWAPGALYHGPYGSQGPWAQPLFEPVAELFRFFQDFGRPKNKTK